MGVNGLETDTTNPKLDPSKDGFTDLPNFNRWQARDEFAYALGYHDSACVGIGNPNLGLVAYAWNPTSGLAGLGDDILGIGDHKGLNNGNIAFMLVNVPQFERQEPNLGISGFAYQYDQLHRIRQSVDYRVKDGKNWEKADLAKTAYTYDPNGNILTLQRTAPNAGVGSGSTDIDDLKYLYYSNTNRLRVVDDSLGAPHAGFGDIGNTTKYYYNAIGQLTSDNTTIASIDWNIQGKVDLVKFGNGNPNVAYTYDSLGNRLSKKVADTTTYYIRDAQGNSFATYKKIKDNINSYDTTRLIEQYLYASSRLGVRSADIIVKIGNENALLPDSARCFSTAVGAVSFEQTNHLGDVVVTLSDKVLGADVDADNTIDYYKSIVKSASLTYPFGWDIPNRKFTAGENYRFGFNGTERSPEIGIGHNTTFFRENDTRIARWWSLDPKPNPSISHYAMMDNNPIAFADAFGDTIRYEASTSDEFKTNIENLRKSSTLFNKVYEKLEEAKNTYIVSVDVVSEKNKEGAGGQIFSAEKTKNGKMVGKIIFYPESFEYKNKPSETIYEEFFHAYQETFYGHPIHSTEKYSEKMGKRRYVREWESEAKFARYSMIIEELTTHNKPIDIEVFLEYDSRFGGFGMTLGTISESDRGSFAALYLYEKNGKQILPVDKNNQSKESYFLYLKGFQQEATIPSYQGRQRKLIPNAYNSLFTK